MLKIIVPLALVFLLLFVMKARAQKTAGSYEDIDVSEFKTKMTESNVVILDVRTAGEIAGGKIKGAVEMDALKPGFKDKLAQLDKSKTYLVYCRSGRRSAGACSSMSGMGFEQVYNLRGGYDAWQRAK